MKQITIRIATLEDATLLAELGATTFYETFAKDNSEEDMTAYLQANFTVERLEEELSVPHSIFLIAECAGKPKGYAKLNKGTEEVCVEGSSAIEIVRLYLLTEAIGIGLGSALMQACLHYAIEHGFLTIWLGVWEHNPQAIAFYRKWGFEQVGSHVFQLGNDQQTDLILQKNFLPSAI